MGNPWEEIPLADYEAHMSSDSVRQTQTLRRIMQSQLEAVYHTVEPRGLRSAMAAAGWRTVYEEESPLPDGKRLARLDFTPISPGAAGRMEDGLP